MAVVYVLVFTIGRRNGSGLEHPGVGQPIGYDIAFSALTADAPTKSDEWDGKVVVLNFWATWCPPCRKEFPHIVQLHRQFENDEAFHLVSVSSPSAGVDLESLHSATQAFAKKHGATFGTYYDAIGRSMRNVVSAAKLPTQGIPITVVVDKSGTIRGVWQGFVSGDEVEVGMLVGALLKGEGGELEG